MAKALKRRVYEVTSPTDGTRIQIDAETGEATAYAASGEAVAPKKETPERVPEVPSERAGGDPPAESTGSREDRLWFEDWEDE